MTFMFTLATLATRVKQTNRLIFEIIQRSLGKHTFTSKKNKTNWFLIKWSKLTYDVNAEKKLSKLNNKIFLE